VDLSFSVELSDVNQDQTIEAPSGAKPIDELAQQLGGLGALGGLGGLGGGGLDDLGGGDLGGGGGGAAGGDTDAYLECVQNAGNDPEQAAECLDEL
jgi:DC-EC Repeat